MLNLGYAGIRIASGIVISSVAAPSLVLICFIASAQCLPAQDPWTAADIAAESATMLRPVNVLTLRCNAKVARNRSNLLLSDHATSSSIQNDTGGSGDELDDAGRYFNCTAVDGPITFAEQDGAHSPSFKVSLPDPHIEIAFGVQRGRPLDKQKKANHPTVAMSISPDSALAGWRDGTAAARQRGVGGYFALGLVSGLAIGIGGPIAFGESGPDLPPLAVAGAGVGGMIGTVSSAAHSGAFLSPDEATSLSQRDSTYQRAFRDAYQARVRERRKRAAFWGGATGAAAGIGAVLLFLLRLRT